MFSKSSATPILKAEKFVHVQDNLNTHNRASLYEAFTASVARAPRRALRMALHAQSSSWLNMAESELAILSRRCLDLRIPDRRNLEQRAAAWLRDRNIHYFRADWRFTTGDAGIKLKGFTRHFG
jgi:DDE superfamily endonuclease